MLRPWQRYFSEEALRVLREKRPAVIAINSPTGSGKTLTALKIAKETLEEGISDKVFFLVRTVTQVLAPIRDAERFFGDLKISPLVGKERSCPVGGGSVSLCKVCPWRERLPPPPKSWIEIFDWISAWTKRAYCPYMAMKKYVKESDIVVMPSAYMNPSIFKSLGMDIENTLLIFDEAHNLFNFMRENRLGIRYGISILSQSPKLIRGLRDKYPDLAEEMSYYTHLLQRLRDVLKSVEKYKVLRRGIRVPDIKESLSSELEDLAKVIERIAVKLALESDPLYDLAEKLVGLVDFFTLALDPQTMVYLDNDTLVVKELKPWIKQYLEKGASGAVLMSGTMPSPKFLKDFIGQLDAYLSLLGNDLLRSEYFKLYNPEHVKVFLITDYTSRYKVRYDKGNVMKRELIEEASLKLAKEMKGVALLVYPSYAMLKGVRPTLKVIAKRTGMEILYSERGGGAAIMTYAKKLKVCAIAAVAGDQLTEGVELTENGKSLIKVVSIIGAPFPSPSAFLEDVAKSIDKDNYEMILNEIYEEEMIMRVKQAIGRMIRSPEDKGIVILADYRFREYLKKIVPYRKTIEITSEEFLKVVT